MSLQLNPSQRHRDGARGGLVRVRPGGPGRALLVLALLSHTAAWAAAAVTAEEPALIRAVRLRQADGWAAALRIPAAAGARDADGNTALHHAALNHDRSAVEALVAAGAEVDARNAGAATPLLYGAGDADIVRTLLAKGADPNAVSALLHTPLMVAAAQPGGAEAVRLLLAAGANVRATKRAGREIILNRGISSGNRRTVELLLAAGADLNPREGFSPLCNAAFLGDTDTVRELLARGADLNHDGGFAGHALNWAFYSGHEDIARLLIERGADLGRRSPSGHGTPPMVWAAYNQNGDAALARLLVARGVDPGLTNDAGVSAAAWARRAGSDTPLVAFLREAGAPPPLAVRERRPPARSVPEDPAARAALVRSRLPATLDLLQRSSLAFLDNAFVRKAGCVSCHGQDLPAVVVEFARERGFKVDDAEVGQRLAAHFAMWAPKTAGAREMAAPLPDMPVSAGYGFFGLAALRHEADATTDAFVRYLLRVQAPDGSWLAMDRRPPMEDGPVVATAWAALAVRDYSPAGYTREQAESQAGSARWLRAQTPATHNDAAMQLLGLHWSGVPAGAVQTLVDRLRRSQREDGGWAQLPGLQSDAWATGLALYALHEAGGLPIADPSYRRGVAFLLRTQFEDGSWWVRSRTWPFQPHFDSRFPHGKDQWISQGGTAWAALALLLTLEPLRPAPARPSAADLQAAFAGRTALASPRAEPAGAAGVSPPEGTAGAVDFARDIQPLLQRSCLECHGAQKPRGGLSLTSRDSMLKGGGSGEPAIAPGRARDSVLLEYVQGKFEDLEMPPLHRRDEFPALTEREIDLLRAWIDAGAP